MRKIPKGSYEEYKANNAYLKKQTETTKVA